MLNSVGLFVTLIDSCNLDCKFCEFPNRAKFRTGNTINYDKFIHMLSQLKAEPPNIPLGAISFCGSGEPLLYDKIVEIVSESKIVVPEVSIVTNGILLNEQVTEGLLCANINHIVISITGNTSATYSNYQGSGRKTKDAGKQFEIVRHNVDVLVKMRNKMRSNTQIGISYILSDDSKDDYFSALSYWRETGVDYVDARILSKGFKLDKNSYSEYIKKNPYKWNNGNYMGIEIREPECLKNETNEVVVLITSLYLYRIEKQLIKMGVRNYFSSLLFIEEHIAKEQFMIFF